MDLSKVEKLREKIDDLTSRETALYADLSALQQGIMGLMENRPTTFLAGKLRDRKIRKATETLNEGKEALVHIKSLLRVAEVELQIALEKENAG
ncbi:hypothetical protein M8756_16845 [Lutimaribacter sp. EGI FJ00015]|uniref:Uncharacterized protein n=1 Tax=Lutimaribacter degradans TaxID=2945989 RepID=A0ACC5ZZK8_9RHOB|nr:hypothetical protein [Lutimaribacter sp. EGI FJ00013]MCM2563794.1 hypothetical protein [Lutimaribacter sp. EGI FJ00013]MCO0614981.1 hypothetical protein [Lutimaribacter sp. EGI FJ00015]